LNSTMFELRTFLADSKFDKCFKHLVVECEFMEKSLFQDRFPMVCTDIQREQTIFLFSNPTYRTNCSIESTSHSGAMPRVAPGCPLSPSFPSSIYFLIFCSFLLLLFTPHFYSICKLVRPVKLKNAGSSFL